LCERPFALYPAMTWEHKNHLRLLEALARLRDRDGLKLPFVFTGNKTDFWPCVEGRVDELGLGGQVSFFGSASARGVERVLPRGTVRLRPDTLPRLKRICFNAGTGHPIYFAS
jgi:glycosyltransferase involved in cell wall biosynthesis